MKLDEAKKILKENNYILNETTAISAPETVLGMCVMKALEKYKDEVREQIKEGEETGDEDDIKAGKLWLSKIEKAEENLEEEDFGSAILKLLGIEEFNPYYP
jgi:hypothetical protein